MQVVGVDFGTTNVRISTWDSQQDPPPEVKLIGELGATTMPAVVAFQRDETGKIDFVVGEEADALQDEKNKTRVIRNIKRDALSNDEYVAWHSQIRDEQQVAKGKKSQWPRPEWDADKGCFTIWGEEFPVWDLIYRILAEAFRRAGIIGDFEWRAGCPVHADVSYRSGLAQALFQVTGKGDIGWVSEEPILFLTLARRLGDLGEGSYVVYDIGGGSFDCALVEVKGNEMLVYGADGHPLLGGSDVDDGLITKVDYTGQPDLLRQAKERLSSSNPSETLSDGNTITLDDVESVLKEGRFSAKSISTTRDAYVSAKTLWKRDRREGIPAIGEMASSDPETGEVKFVWQLMWDDLARDIDKIIMFGGPTRAEYFSRELSKRFGDDKVIAASDILPTLIGTPDLELVGISLGACYSYEDSYDSLYLNRIPARIILQDLHTGAKVEYMPYQHLEYRRDESRPMRPPVRSFKPGDIFVSEPIPQEKTDPHEYELTITYPNDVLIQDPIDPSRPARFIIDGYLESGQDGNTSRQPATSLRMIIDRYGRVGIEKHSSGPGLPWTKVSLIVDAPPWQTDLQNEATGRDSQQRPTETASVVEAISESPFAEHYQYPSEQGHIEGIDSPYPHGRRS